MIACTSPNPQDFKEEAQKYSSQLITELQKIRTRDDLLLHVNELETSFNAIADVIVRARDYQQRYPEADFSGVSQSDSTMNDQLSIEMNRILHMEGGREILLKVQEKALLRIKCDSSI